MSSLPATHKAVVFTGSTENRKLVEIIDTATIYPPPANKLLVKVKAFALNPTDWKHIIAQLGEKGDILGTDSSGEVVAVGSDVKGFEVGDNVSSFTHGGYKADPTGGSFQDYAIVDPKTTIKYTKKLSRATATLASKVRSFEGAASITLGLATVGMSFQHSMKLTLNPTANKGKYILIWGGATATGILAVQVAKKLYGLTVIVAASKKHHAWLRRHGADYAFDYHDADVVEQIRKVTDDKLTFALDTVAIPESYNPAYKCLSHSEPAVLDNLLDMSEDTLENPPKRDNVKLTQTLSYLLLGDQVLNGVEVLGSKDIDNDHATYWKAAQKAVNDGIILHAPLTILHGGYNAVEEGFSVLRNGDVSGEKLIIIPEETN
ncbi:hypothetical protein FOA43_001932 [Brettanomyces nanus]|uniref:Enoyl reductase (ER) domain-containing protein n=1 Tax=Eeniella nana TaxID=13502 RepID=A0A875RYJ4_EENNA|nr:uncharacterized protein FOA43_001932 [Brettanomyces nanus]QPG74601.1 hypothetical protein FOA43_001932 [Brettanomyces nanus]